MIRESDKPYTAFEANGNLYQFTRIPFGVTNGVAVFQRAIDKFVKEELLCDKFPYVDNITIGGRDQKEHDLNVEKFLVAAEKRKLTFNKSKSVISAKSINLLGYQLGNGQIKPDPDRLTPLLELPPPTNKAALQRVLGMFAYYAKWIPEFSDKARTLYKTKSFPLTSEALEAFANLKGLLGKATLSCIDYTKIFVVECDASDIAVSATLNQDGRPVAFMSRTLSGSELHYPPVEKEATVIIEGVRKWSHLLAGRHFIIVTDQRSVAFMLDNRRRSKIKNDKIQGWRLELACFSYSIRYRPGAQNVAPDTFSRATCGAISSSNLNQIHEGLCHPGVVRMLHFIRTKNLPFSTDDVKRVCSSCRICCEIKPSFHRPQESTLIKATQPMERLSIDFKGPLPSRTVNKYLFTAVDEYSRFPFAIPCSDMTSATVIKCLDSIFSLCGMPSFIHSDRGGAFMSREVKAHLISRGVASSKTTPYHPTGNSQVERYNGIIWKSLCLAAKSHKVSESNWESLLPEALHSIRSLLSTATNETPHERFFRFSRRSCHGTSLPTWLMSPGPVFLRRFVRHNKNDPLVDEVELLEANPTYAHIKYPDGRESSVSLRDLAPCPKGILSSDNKVEIPSPRREPDIASPCDIVEADTSNASPSVQSEEVPLRRSTRHRQEPQRYGWEE